MLNFCKKDVKIFIIIFTMCFLVALTQFDVAEAYFSIILNDTAHSKGI